MENKNEIKWSGIITALHLIFYYTIAIGIWGLALKSGLPWFILVGFGIGLLLGIIAYKVISIQKSVDKTKDLMFAMGSTFGNIAIIIGIIGAIVLIVRLIFF